MTEVNILHTAKELKPDGRKVCLAIGFFDGAHLGHQQILRQAISDARQHDAVEVALTFDRHPNVIVAPDKVPPLIYSLPQKLRAIASLGIGNILLVRFDKKFSEQSGEDFVQGLARGFGKIHSICVGANFVFGHRRSGNVALLKKLGAELDFQVHGLAAVSLDGRTVSSTRVREVIGAGNLDVASQMLGRPYAICGRVVKGDQLGRKLGFPTANLDAEELVLPPNGVYSGRVKIKGRVHRVALNIGFRPTVTSARLRPCVEAHVLHFNGELYGSELEVELGEKLRDERKFASPSELKAQIARDIASVIEKAG